MGTWIWHWWEYCCREKIYSLLIYPGFTVFDFEVRFVEKRDKRTAYVGFYTKSIVTSFAVGNIINNENEGPKNMKYKDRKNYCKSCC